MAATALLVMDVQNGVVERLGPPAAALLAAVRTATMAARSNGVAVIYVRVGFRPGGADLNPRNRIFSRLPSPMDVSDPTTQVHSSVLPQHGDIEVVKKRVSAFVGSDLDVVLRSLDVSSLVLSGISTSGVVLSTLRQAADLDYELTVLRDACADPDPEVHRVLLDKVFVRQAFVVATADWAGGLRTNISRPGDKR